MRFVDSTVLANMTIGEDTRFSISIIARNVILLVAVLVGLTMIGIDLSALSILFGVLGIGLGFGLQGNIANFFAGFTLIFERPIKEGDRIVVGGLEGDVRQVRLRSTVINTLTNETIIVPNRQLVENSIHNHSYGDPRIIIVNRVEVAYETDLDEAMEILLLVNETNPYALRNAETEVRVVSFEESGILLELRTWIKSAPDKHQATSWLNFEIWRHFKDAGVVIPFPQRDVYVKHMAASEEP
jgi:small-conductance mechanosensitive channel